MNWVAHEPAEISARWWSHKNDLTRMFCPFV